MAGVIAEDPETKATAGSGEPVPNHRDVPQKDAGEEKLLPPGNPAESAVPLPPANPAPAAKKPEAAFPKPPDLADLLHSGNAVAAAQSKQSYEAAVAFDEDSEEPLERSLREIGLKEAMPHGGKAPPRSEIAEEGEAGGLPRVHTYAEDMSREIKKRGVTLSSIITAEKISPGKPADAAPKRSRRGILFLGGALFLLILGVGAVIGVLSLVKSSSPPIVLPASLIPINHRVQVSTDPARPLSSVLADAKAGAAMQLGEIEAIDVLRGSALLSPQEALTALGAPDELGRNATGLLVGVHAFNGNQPFLLVSVADYDRAFKAMLTWESTMGDSLGFFFAPNGVTPDSVTTRPPALSFTDRVVANLDVRESQTAWPILYTFLTQNLLLITTNESTVREVLTRLSLQSQSN